MITCKKRIAHRDSGSQYKNRRFFGRNSSRRSLFHRCRHVLQIENLFFNTVERDTLGGKAMSESWFAEERPGLDRLTFFLAKVGLGVIMVVAITWLGPGSSLIWALGLVLSFVGFALDVMRLRNIGVSQWFAVLRFVPYVNLVYMILLQSAQGGWIETRRLDRTGRTLLMFQIGLVVLVVMMLAKMSVSVPNLLF